MTKVSKVAIKTPSGKVKSAKPPAHHADLKAKGKRGFLLSDGKFVNRTEGGKVAKKAKQVAAIERNPFLHSSDLAKGYTKA